LLYTESNAGNAEREEVAEMQPRIIGRYRRADGSVVRCGIRIEQPGTQRVAGAVVARERAVEVPLSPRAAGRERIEPHREPQDVPVGKL
jgi:hypothetical protein